MRVQRILRTLAVVIILAVPAIAHATAEICGNGIDDNSNGMTDEGCYPSISTGVCESPLSCNDTGMISWATGSLHYDLPPDINPTVPFGPGIGFRRFYTSMYTAPGSGASYAPLGAHWQHTYMTWVLAVSGTSNYVLHTSDGRDILMVYASNSGGYNYYTPQAGFSVMSFKQNTSTLTFSLQYLTGETVEYNSSGYLTTLTDIAGNSVAVTTSSGATSTVTDAAGYRRLNFSYTSGLLTEVDYQTYSSGSWTTQQSTLFTYSSGYLASTAFGSTVAQYYYYDTSHNLYTIDDGTGNQVVYFNYYTSTAGRVSQVRTSSGSVGFDYNSTRSGCPVGGGTMIYFNLANTSSCGSDADCGTGNMCGESDELAVEPVIRPGVVWN